MTTVSVKLPASTDAKLTAAARRRGGTKSDVIREALDAHFTRRRGDDRASCLDLVGDLVGCIQGPVDLASNPRHMRRYGR